MTDLRKLTSQLNLEVSDKISGDLGYRRYSVIIPLLGTLNPRPKVEDISGRSVPEFILASWIDTLGRIPNKVYNIYLAKWYNNQELTEAMLTADKRLWSLADESGQILTVRPLQFKDQNSRIIVTVGVIKTI